MNNGLMGLRPVCHMAYGLFQANSPSTTATAPHKSLITLRPYVIPAEDPECCAIV